ncbi:hypothetical protein GOP47_0020457 [Adiantum capillus-veneris]|uniref:Uncharacterized protein n=1 Tax=Adiantum capillus-veneris TaxID=13818 RepID=A0A9D4Z7R6_ADICA|nr:hypothetical protein GOP47_0020457 [Adiantum capillus-veneris]
MRFTTNNVLEGMNLIMAGLATAVIGVSAWLATHARQDCLTFLQWPFMAIGLLIFGVGLLGYFGSARRSKPLLLLYLLLLLLITLLLLSFTLFAVVVTTQNGPGRRPLGPPARFHEFTSADFSAWLRKRVGPPHWTSIQACLKRGRLCRDLDKYTTLQQLYSARDLSPAQVGCCKPPSICGFMFETPTTWVPSMMSTSQATSDCRKWSNNPSKLCFECDACRAGEMQNVRQHWLHVAIVGLLVSILLLTLLALTSITLQNIKHNSMPDETESISPNI